jgi:hypothetical protein
MERHWFRVKKKKRNKQIFPLILKDNSKEFSTEWITAKAKGEVRESNN